MKIRGAVFDGKAKQGVDAALFCHDVSFLVLRFRGLRFARLEFVILDQPLQRANCAQHKTNRFGVQLEFNK